MRKYISFLIFALLLCTLIACGNNEEPLPSTMPSTTESTCVQYDFTGATENTAVSGYVSVPDLVGKAYRELPDYDDFTIKIDQEIISEQYPAGQIVHQVPAANQQIEKGQTIYVTVSLGKSAKSVDMPNIVDWELSQAEKSLNNLSMNLRIQVEEEHHDTIAKGSVIRSIPNAETELTVGQEVVLYVSLGKETKTTTMPEVEGKTLEIAKKILENQEMDLDVQVEEEFSSTVASGEVIRSEPELGGELKTGQKVKLIVSKGPELAKMPYVVELSVEKAVSILNTSGFKNYKLQPVESDRPKDEVVRQSVEANTEVDVTTEIVLEYSRGPADIPEVTIDVTINLRGSAATGECQVTVKRGNDVVFNEKVPQGTESITIKNQKGSGTEYFEIMIGIGEDGWIEKVKFQS